MFNFIYMDASIHTSMRACIHAYGWMIVKSHDVTPNQKVVCTRDSSKRCLISGWWNSLLPSYIYIYIRYFIYFYAYICVSCFHSHLQLTFRISFFRTSSPTGVFYRNSWHPTLNHLGCTYARCFRVSRVPKHCRWLRKGFLQTCGKSPLSINYCLLTLHPLENWL